MDTHLGKSKSPSVTENLTEVVSGRGRGFIRKQA